MRKSYSIAIIIFCTLVISSVVYFIQYPTRIDKLSLEKELQKFEEIKDIKIQKVEVLDNKIIAMYTYSNGSGYGTFEKGYNGRCLLTSSSRSIGGVTFQEGYIKTNKGGYNLFAGKNYDNKIKSIEFAFEDGKKLMYDVSKEDYFILAMSNPTGSFSFFKFDLLDEKGNNLKNEIIQKYLKNNTSGQTKAKMELSLFNFWYVFIALISTTIIYSSYRANKKGSISNY